MRLLKALLVMVCIAGLATVAVAGEGETLAPKGDEPRGKSSGGQSITDDSDPITRWFAIGPIDLDKLYKPINDLWREILDSIDSRHPGDEPEEEEEEEESFGFIGGGTPDGRHTTGS